MVRLRGRRVLGADPLADPRPSAAGQPERILVSAVESVGDRDIAKYARAARAALAAAGRSA